MNDDKADNSQQIDECCDKFEAMWGGDKAFSIEEVLSRLPEDQHPPYVSALLAVEIELRAKSDHPATADELHERFPNLKSAVDEALQAPAAKDSLANAEAANQQTVAPRNQVDDDKSVPAAGQLRIPRQLGRYRIIRKLGQGAMGSVFLAHDEQLDRQVALKIPRGDLQRNREMRLRFEREAQAAAALHHPNICPIHDIGEYEGVHYICMGYIKGFSLTRYAIAESGLSEQRIAELVLKMARALAVAHEAGFIHRDLKPANVMVNLEDEPVILDFGLARRIDRGEDLKVTQTGTTLGSPAYMSPEQVDGDQDKVGPHSDVYSLGVILYELLTGRIPFEGSLASVMGQIMTKEPDKPSEYRKDLSVRLENICQRMMAKDPDKRHPSMHAVVAGLKEYLDKFRAKPTPNPDDPDEPRIDQGQRRREQITKLIASGDYGQAEKLLVALSRETDDSLVKAATWAATELPKLRKTREEVRAGRQEMYNTAARLMKAHDYEQAARLLEEYPYDMRTPKMQELLEEAEAMTNEVKLLRKEIKSTRNRGNNAELLRLVTALLEIKPGDRRAKELREQLTNRNTGPITKILGRHTPSFVERLSAGVQTALAILLVLATTSYPAYRYATSVLTDPPSPLPPDPAISLLAGPWKHIVENVSESTLTFREDGTIFREEKESMATWELNGRDLILTWKNSDAPNGVWIDTLRFNETGDQYAGTTLNEVHVSGRRLKNKSRQIPNSGGCALDFSSDQYSRVEIPTLRYNPAKPLTIEAWVFADSGTAQGIISAFTFLPGAKSLGVYLGTTNAKWDLEFGTGQNFEPSLKPEHVTVMFRKWTHIAGVVSEESIQLYIDGKLATERRLTVGIATPADHFYLGVVPQRDRAEDTEPRFNFGFMGELDEIRVSESERYSSNFVPQRRFEADDETTALYHCDAGDGDILEDDSGNGHHGRMKMVTWVDAERAEVVRDSSGGDGVSRPVSRLYVNCQAPENGDGRSWSSAFRDLQAALLLAKQESGHVKEIWIAAGTYHPSGDGDQEISFELVDGVAIHGGFRGNEVKLDDRHSSGSETILSGDLKDNDRDDFANREDNSFRVVEALDLKKGAAMNSVTILAGGRMEVNGRHHNGGGLRIQGSAILSNLRITGCEGRTGGGMLIEPESRVQIRNSTFVNNRSKMGGGVCVTSRGTQIHDCAFESNSSVDDGAGLALGSYGLSHAGDTVVRNCRFVNNSAFGEGGAVVIRERDVVETAPTRRYDFVECIFEGNTSAAAGVNAGALSGGIGARMMPGASLNLLNCRFIGNKSASNNSAAGLAFWGNAKVDGCTFTNNRCPSGATIQVLGWGRLSLGYCTIAGNQCSTQLSLCENARVDLHNSVLHTTENSSSFTKQEKANVNITNSCVNEGGRHPKGSLGTPAFANVATNDFSLTLQSPGRGQGDKSRLPPDTFDLDNDGDISEALPIDVYGNPRMSGGKPNVGAIE